MTNNATGVMWRRLRNFLSPQMAIYHNLNKYTEGKSVLEVGFGTGAGTMQYVFGAESVDGIELDRDAVDFANEVFPVPTVTWRNGDIASEAFYGQKYDVAIMIETLEHIPDYHTALRNLANCAPLAIISVPNANADLRKNPLHEQEWTAQEFVSILQQFYGTISLFDYRLETELETNTSQTPILAICHRGKTNGEISSKPA